MIRIHKLTLQTKNKRPSQSSWIFSNEVKHLDEKLLDARKCALVRVENSGRIGVYHKGSLAAVRLLPESIGRKITSDELSDSDFVALAKDHLLVLRTAKQRLIGEEAFRWSHGDADGLPGIVIDDYGQACVLQCGNAAGEYLLDFVVQAYGMLENRPLFERSSGQVRQMEGLPERTRWIVGNGSDGVQCSFAGLTLGFNLSRAQKTGLFLDQRENLRTLVRYLNTKQKTFTSMLDICSYAGAWSSVGASCGLSYFTLIDQDKDALQCATDNIKRNAARPLQDVFLLHGDMFEHLSALGNQGKKFSVVVADPPAFAKSAKHVPEARRAYARMAKLSSRLVENNGILVVCSCSRNMEEGEFVELVSRNLVGDDWIFLSKGSQSPDHTVPLHEAYSQYLKCLFFMKRTL